MTLRPWNLLVALTLTTAGCGDNLRDLPATDAGTGVPDADAPTPAVELVRDGRGVPHIFAATLERAMFGLGFATAQDRLLQMQLRRLTMRGQLAEWFAVDPDDGDSTAAATFNARLVKGDRAVRTLGYARHADAIADRLPTDVVAQLRAYADGVNSYLESEEFRLPAAFTELGLPAPEPWTPADSLLAWEWVGHHFTGALGGLQDELDMLLGCEAGACPRPACPLPLDEAAAVVPPPADGTWPPSSATPIRRRLGMSPVDRGEVEVKASHGWVVHGSRTTTGRPVLVGEPQLALEAPSTWYEFHVRTPEVDARGVGVAGAPGYFIFWNDHVAQTVTAGGTDVADLFELTLTPDGDGYVVDGMARPIARRTETIAVRFGEPLEVTVSETAIGPIVDDLLTGRPAGRSFAARHVELVARDTHSIVAGLRLIAADSLASYRAAIAHWATPAVNALYAGVDAGAPADDPGHIAYHALMRIPVRARIERGDMDLTGRIPYDGARGDHVWTEVLDLDWNPHVIDPPAGYLFSGNHLPVGSWYDDVVYAGLKSSGDTYRSLRLRYRLAELLPAGGVPVSPATLHAMHVDDDSDAARLLSDMFDYLAARGVGDDPGDLGAEPTGTPEIVARVRLALRAWVDDGGHLRWSDPRTPLVLAATRSLATRARAQVTPAIGCVYNGGQSGASALLKAFAADPSGTMNAEVAEFLGAVAVEAWSTTRPALASPDPGAWSASIPPFTVAYQRNFTCLRPGIDGLCSLRPDNEVVLALDQTVGDTINSAGGSSYPLTVDFADPEASFALLPPGTSEDPASPHFADGLTAIEAKAQGHLTAIPVAPRARTTVDAQATEVRGWP